MDHTTERENVVGRIRRVARELLRTGGNQRTAARILAGSRRNAEVDQVRRTVVIEKDVRGFDVSVYDAFCMCISQGIRDQRDRRQRFCRRRAGEHANIRSVDVLQAVESPVVLVEFERAHDMCVHQANRELPLASQCIVIDAIVHEDLERDRRAGDPVRREPGLGRAPSA
jgi:hypothetical protein